MSGQLLAALGIAKPLLSVRDTTYQEGETVTFGEQPLTWETLDAAPGEYIVGFIVEDLDGNAQAAYAQVTVR